MDVVAALAWFLADLFLLGSLGFIIYWVVVFAVRLARRSFRVWLDRERGPTQTSDKRSTSEIVSTSRARSGVVHPLPLMSGAIGDKHHPAGLGAEQSPPWLDVTP